jgi:5-methylcytosine-specific restriction endonuclease McrA
MRSRVALENKHVPYLLMIHEAKRGNVRAQLDAIEHKWVTNFETYEAKFTIADLATLPKPNWVKIEREALLHCYNSSTAALSELKAGILTAQNLEVKGLCPYCGVGTTEEFDHYAPKEYFPHLAIHTLNLVPCCGRCNKKKSTLWLKANQRQILHFYLDALPTEQFLFATVTWLNTTAGPVPTATYSLQCPDGFPSADFALIERHFTNMELSLHYRKNTPRVYTELRKLAKIARPKDSKEAIKKALMLWAKETFAEEGFGSWKAAFALTLAQNVSFLAQMTTP